VANMEEKIKHKILVGKSEGERSHGRPGHI
jgi:hypothetical protein